MEETSVRQIKSVCVFCGSNPGKDEEFVKIANNLGRVLPERKIQLVYGGGSLRLMSCLATAAYLEGSKVLGVIPRALVIGNTAGKIVRDEILVSCIHERINIMIKKADAFIALLGGFGTLEEIFQIVSWSQLNIHQKSIGILNINGFYDSLFCFLDHAAEQRFISQATRQILVTATTPEQLLDQLQAFVPQRDPTMALLNWKKDNNSKKRKLNLTLCL
ncbi:hypothetical protein REPUB_Repub12eG0033300 [Reevesia pubescens]